MRRIICLCVGLLLCQTLHAQTTHTYQYWFDQQYGLSHTDSCLVVGNHGAFHFDVSTLPVGFHTVTLMMQDTSGTWGVPQTSSFLRIQDTFGGTGLVYRCWFDNNYSTARTGNLQNNHIDLDVSHLSTGIHSVNVYLEGANTPQSYIFFKEEDTIGRGLRYHCWFDDDISTIQSGNLGNGLFFLDVSSLTEGLHSVTIQAERGARSLPKSYMFFRVADTIGSAMTFRWWFDDDYSTVHSVSLSSGIFSVDVSSLENGLHYLNIQAGMDAAIPMRYLFYKIPNGGYGINRYEYCLNGDWEHASRYDTVPCDTLRIIRLLQVDTVPIRSNCFQFAPNNGVPLVYAKNEINFRFWDNEYRHVDKSGMYVDMNVVDTVYADTLERNTTKVIAAPRNNAIHWFKLAAGVGDSLSFHADRRCTMQLYAPSGEMVFHASGDSVLIWTGCHAWESGVYYLAVHDAEDAGDVAVSYQWIYRYAVLAWNVHRVGNGGISTITFEGNGFNSLDTVFLIKGGDTIPALSIEREKNTTTSILFDFANVDTGMYNAYFMYVDENIYVPNVVRVDTIVPIRLVTSVDYPETFLRGSSVTYSFEITNVGNMTAYTVPMYLYVGTAEFDAITDIRIHGLNLPKIYDYLTDWDSLTYNEKLEWAFYSDIVGDEHFFLPYLNVDDNGDSISKRIAYFFLEVAPYETRQIDIEITATDSVSVWISTPDDWAPVSSIVTVDTSESADYQQNPLMPSKPIVFPMTKEVCTWINTLEHLLGGMTLGDYLIKYYKANYPRKRLIGFQFVDWGAPVEVYGTYAKSSACNNRILKYLSNQLTKYRMFSHDMYISIPGVVNKAIQEATERQNNGTGIQGAVAGEGIAMDSIVGPLLRSSLLYGTHERVEVRNVLGTAIAVPVSSTIRNTGRVVFVGRIKRSAMPTPVPINPGCCSKPAQGGTSVPVNSLDPNEIVGYLANSGSYAVSAEREQLYYSIEFENDTAFASANAHTVQVVDTLDGNVFDLSSFAATSFSIGEQVVALNGEKSFIRTVDMRPAINVLAEVRLEYDDTAGIARWTFRSLDPMTLQETTDPTLGFLPANYNGDGIGQVDFLINRKSTLRDSAIIDNRAYIVFDNEAPIATSTWRNIMDITPPVSSIDSVIFTGGMATVTMSATDNLSGVWRYHVYAQENTMWQRVASDVPADSVAMFVAETNTYTAFRTTAIDSAGNVEPLNGIVDDTVYFVPLAVEAGAWYAISPLTHNTANGNETVEGVTNLVSDTIAYDLFYYDESNATWRNYKVHSFDLEAGVGYVYRRSAADTLRFTGEPNTDSIEVTLTAGASNGDLRGFNLIGNPYPYEVGYGSPYYELRPNGTWYAHTSGVIDVAQGFLVHTTIPTTYTFTYPTPDNAKGAERKPLAFTVAGNGYEDVVYVLFDEGEGLPKITHLSADAPALSVGGKAIAVLGRETEEFPLTLRAMPGDYALTAHPSQLYYLHLIDKATGAERDLLADSSYTFRHRGYESDAERFVVRLAPAMHGAERETFAYTDGTNIVVRGEGLLQVFDMLGRLVMTCDVNSEQKIPVTHFHTGVYALRLAGKSQKIVIR